jgi:hypothetical protein
MNFQLAHIFCIALNLVGIGTWYNCHGDTSNQENSNEATKEEISSRREPY